jgi:siroheme synthase (precorrin-2 oxidase/ferrochelatase)
MRAFADKHKFLYCAIDQPKHGFVAMTAIVKAGPARISISTGGVSPRVGGKLRAALQGALDETFTRFLACLGTQKLRNRTDIAESSQRRARMIKAAEGFEVSITLTYPQWFQDELRAFGPSVLPRSPHTPVTDADPDL